MMLLLNYINGRLQPSLSGRWLNNYNPATGRVYSQVPDSDTADAEAAVHAAQAAFPAWAALTATERAAYLERIAALIEANLHQLAVDEVTDNGKTFTQASHVEIPRSASNFRFFAQAITQFASESHHPTGHTLNYTLRQPMGVVTCISPWNLPLYLFTWKIAPALAAGNTVVAKPSEITPLTAFRLAELCIEAGLPAGVLNIIHGTGPQIGNAMTGHPLVKAITFTGSTATGRHIAALAAPQFKKLSLELGGKNPALVFDDCDYEQTLNGLVRSTFSNQGEICLCSSKLFVQRGIYERLKHDLTEKVAALTVGDPMDAATKVGAIVSRAHFEKVLSYIELAKKEGGEILCGGHAVPGSGDHADGWFIAPTLIAGLSNSCRTNQEEIFGPVATLIPFDTEDEAIALANENEYGLSATIWTRNLNTAHRAANQVQAGVIWINTWLNRDLRTPFGGMKNSGVGREGGLEALRFFTEAKNVCIELQ